MKTEIAIRYHFFRKQNNLGRDKLGLYLKWEFKKKDTLKYNNFIYHVDKMRALE